MPKRGREDDDDDDEEEGAGDVAMNNADDDEEDAQNDEDNEGGEGEGEDEDEEDEDEDEEDDDDDDDDDDSDEDSDEDDDDSDSSEAPEIDTSKVDFLAKTRERRSTAGRRMAALIDQEDNDDTFYAEKFGDEIFHESGSDFASSEEESWDELDSDFDAAEADDAAKGQDDQDGVYEPEDLVRKRKIYQDPLAPKPVKRGPGRPPGKPKKAVKVATPRLELTSATVPMPGKKRGRKPGVSYAKKPPPQYLFGEDLEPGQPRKSHRAHAVDMGRQLAQRQESEAGRQKREREEAPEIKLTQEDRLRQAAITELENTASLARFKMREAEKKKQLLRKTTYKGPVIRYTSTTRVAADGSREGVNYVTFTDEGHLATLFTPAFDAYPPPNAPRGAHRDVDDTATDLGGYTDVGESKPGRGRGRPGKAVLAARAMKAAAEAAFPVPTAPKAAPAPVPVKVKLAAEVAVAPPAVTPAAPAETAAAVETPGRGARNRARAATPRGGVKADGADG